MNIQSPGDDPSNRQSPLQSNKPGEYRKSIEENNQFLLSQKQMKRINMSGTSELTSPQANVERFADREAMIHMKLSPSEYPPQFQHHQHQTQGIPSNLQGNQGGFNPVQIKGNNMSPGGYYTNPQFFPNNQSPGQPQNFQKRKQKGMMINNPNTNNNNTSNINPNSQNKSFGMNSFPMNQSPNQSVPQNMNPNQFRGNMESKFIPDQSNNQRGPNNQQSNHNKFNRNQERNFQENSGMPQRGFIGSPSFQQQHGGLINIPDLPENNNVINEANIEKVHGNVRNFDENKNIKGRPQQQQGNAMFKNNPNMLFPPGSQFIDGRSMASNMSGQNPGMFSPHFLQQQSQSVIIEFL